MKNNNKVYLLIGIFFLQGIVTNMHHPIMPYYVDFMQLDGYMVGLYFSVMNTGTMFGGPFWGNLGDSGKKKISVILGFSLYGLGQILFGMGHIFGQWPLTIFRFMSGFGIAAASTIIMSEIIIGSTPNTRNRNITFGVASLALGGSVGYFIGGQLNSNPMLTKIFHTDNFQIALLVQGILVGLVALLTFFVYKPTPVEIPEDGQVKKRAQFWEGFKEIKNVGPELLFFLIALVFITIGATNVDKYLDMYFKDLGYDSSTLGNYKMIVGFLTLFATLVIVPLLMKIKKRTLMFSIFQAASAVIVFITFRQTDKQVFIYLVYSLLMVYIVIKASFAPIEQEHVASFSKDSNIATTMGIRQSFYSIGTIIGPLVGGWLYGMNKLSVFYASAILFLLSVVFLTLSGIYKKKNLTENAARL